MCRCAAQVGLLVLQTQGTVPEYRRMRHPRHVRCAPASGWCTWVASNGLTERDARIGRKKHPVRDWVERTVTSKEHMATVEAYALAATPAARECLAN